jgi:hypothetical protein
MARYLSLRAGVVGGDQNIRILGIGVLANERMKPIDGVHKGDLRRSGDLTLAGQVRWTAWVMSGTTFDCRGQVAGDVVVEYGGTAVVRGMVVGKILNAGGTVDLFGMVAAVNDSENSRTIVHRRHHWKLTEAPHLPSSGCTKRLGAPAG